MRLRDMAFSNAHRSEETERSSESHSKDYAVSRLLVHLKIQPAYLEMCASLSISLYTYTNMRIQESFPSGL